MAKLNKQSALYKSKIAALMKARAVRSRNAKMQKRAKERNFNSLPQFSASGAVNLLAPSIDSGSTEDSIRSMIRARLAGMVREELDSLTGNK